MFQKILKLDHLRLKVVHSEHVWMIPDQATSLTPRSSDMFANEAFQTGNDSGGSFNIVQHNNVEKKIH